MIGAAKRHSIRSVVTTATATPTPTSLVHAEMDGICSFFGASTINEIPSAMAH